jgi:hypothetical protein
MSRKITGYIKGIRFPQMRRLCELAVTGLLAVVAPGAGATSSDEVLSLLAVKLSEVRSSTSNERVAIEPVVGVEALQGTTRKAILSRLGSPDNCMEVEETRCSKMNTWVYSFVHLPSGWRGGGPELHFFFGKRGVVKAVAWQRSR